MSNKEKSGIERTYERREERRYAGQESPPGIDGGGSTGCLLAFLLVGIPVSGLAWMLLV